jgi:DNA-binding IclR family transcriptional regulator
LHSQNKSLTRGLQILKEVMTSKKMLTANILCQKLEIDKSTMSRLIKALIVEDFIEYKDNSKEIILSDLMKKIVAKDDRDKIVEKTRVLLDEIFYLTNECSYFGVLDNNAVLYLNQIDKSKRLLRTRDSIGLHAPLHTNAFGKVIMAFTDNFNIINIELEKFTNNTITTTNRLQKELDLIKERGYAIGSEEHEFGLKSVAVPYFNKKNQFVGTVGISGLSVRLGDEDLHKIGQDIFRIVNI